MRDLVAEALRSGGAYNDDKWAKARQGEFMVITPNEFDLDVVLWSLKSSPVKNIDCDNFYHYPLVSRNSKIQEILALIKKVAKSEATVLILGETGTGKEVIAALIQMLSHRA